MAQTVQRFDRGHLRSAVRTDEGYYLVEGYVARPGVLEYLQADGSIRRELVLEEELHRADSLATLGRKPVTLEHPKEDGSPILLGPETIGEHEAGDVDGQIEVEDFNGFVKVKMAVRRQDAVAAVESGIRELSPGYQVDLEEVSGEHPEYGRFDAIQRNRRYNHVAITRAGRAGADVALRTDSAVQTSPFIETDKGIFVMAKNIDDLIDKKINERNTKADAESFQEAYDALKANYDDLKEKYDKLQGQYDALKESNHDEGDGADDRMDWFEERSDALEVASAMGVDVPDRADVPDIKRAVVESHLGDIRTDASEDYLAGVYDHVRAQVETEQAKGRYDGINQALNGNRLPHNQPNRPNQRSAKSGPDNTRLDAAAAEQSFRDKFRN